MKAAKTSKKPRPEVNLETLLDQALASLSPRHRSVLEKRFGLKSGGRLTLAKLGKSYGVTRERVRQLESFGLKSARKNIADRRELVELIKNYLEGLGGLRREDLFFLDLGFLLRAEARPDVFANRLRFFLEVFGEPFYHPENDHHHAFWYLHNNYRTAARGFIKNLEKAIADKKEEVIWLEKFHEFFGRVAIFHKLIDAVALNYLSISKKFHVNPFGHIGLTDWPEIRPRRVGDKAHLILKKHRRPFHFKELTGAINTLRFDNRRAYPQTVHNELIRDDRFVLVGRGLYGLKEHGFSHGTAGETIKKIIKKNGPLAAADVLELVSREKFFKKNTVLVNLQNKKWFKKLPDGRYALARP